MSSYVKQEIQKWNFDTTYGRRRKQWTMWVICHARWFIIHSIWHFNGIWQICFWGDDFETTMSGNGKTLYWTLPNVYWQWQNWPKVRKNGCFDRHFFFRQELLLEGWLVHLTNYAWLDTINVYSLDSMKAQLQRPWK